MDWRDRWRAVDSSVEDAIAASREFVEAAGALKGDDYYGIQDSLLLPFMRGALDQIRSFLGDNKDQFGAAGANLGLLIDKHDAKIKDGGFPATQALLPLLVTARAGVARIMNDAEIIWLPTIERAFAHLQRLMIADPDGVGATWTKAFKSGEVECERLGGAHLLSHGIYGFKAHGEGARTDLVLGQPIESGDVAAKLGTPLVLTEWKVATGDADAAKKVGQADIQVREYGAGVLGGVELHRTRFVVVVSPEHVQLPEDREEAGVRWRRVNIALSPKPPSKQKI